jgi:hypothetical protein
MADDEAVIINSDDILEHNPDFDSIRELKRRFPTECDLILARFLLARDGDVEKASEMISNEHVFRRANMPISKSMFMPDLLTGKMYVHGQDKLGHPLLIFSQCKHWAKERDMEANKRLVMWFLFQAQSVMPPNRSKLTMVIDRTNIVGDNTDIEFTKNMAAVLQVRVVDSS